MADDFWWGTAASSTQAAGSAPASDWRAGEEAGRVPPSGDGNGFATRYAEDFALFADLGLSHHRLSLEWARIEPEPGRRDPAAVEHYRQVLIAAAQAGISAWVCLHHFTLPGWFSVDEHGFADERARSYFWPRHVDFCAETFGDLVFGWKPVNEPLGYAALGWLEGLLPPGHTGDTRGFAEGLESIHLADFDAALRLRQTGRPVACVQIATPLTPAAPTPEDEAMTAVVDRTMWGTWLGAISEGVLRVPGRAPIERADFRDAFDLVGFSYYHASAVRGDGTFVPYPGDARVGPLGYAPWSEGLGLVLHRLAEAVPDKPLLVCEHGVGTDDDAWRTDVLRDSLHHVRQAVNDGIDVRGFFHWTGVDNYEWQHGFTVPFGLFDRARTARPSAELLREHAAQ